MPSYLMQVSYTSQAWSNLLAHPEDRAEAVRPVIEKLGGKLTHSWYTFGDYDVVVIVEMPSNTDAAAFSVAASAGGAVRTIKTTPLLTAAEAMDAMRKASKSGYKAPARA
jgi:uncharacterized protein with GYD domain